MTAEHIRDLAAENKAEQQAALRPHTLTNKPSQWGLERADLYGRNVAALRTAADQLEAVEGIANLYQRVGINNVPADVVAHHLREILTAGAAPHEDQS